MGDSSFPEVPFIREASRRLVRELGVFQGPAKDTSLTQCHILVELGRTGLLTIAQLADLLRLDKSTTSRAAKKLERGGMVAPVQNDHDLRQKPLALTERGRIKLTELHLRADRQVEDALKLARPEQRVTVRQGLNLYAKLLSRARLLGQVRFREIRPEDNLTLQKIIRACMDEWGVAGDPAAGYYDPELEDMHKAYQGKGRVYYVAERDGLVLGGSGLAPLKNGAADTCELQRMYLGPEGRGLGIGARLLSMCLAFAKQSGFGHCYLETMAQAAGARALYEGFGFSRREATCGQTGHRTCNTWYLKDL